MSANVLPMLLQASSDAPRHAYLITTGNVFLLFFIMLGPLKAIGPYFNATREMDGTALRALAWKVFALSVATAIVAGLLGSAMLHKWQISDPVMEFAGGLIFLLVALQLVLAQYQPPPPPPAEKSKTLHLLFPVTITPYGVAALVAMMALSAESSRSLTVLGLAIAVLALDLLALLFARPIMRWIGPVPLQILGAVLGVLQVALALQFMLAALRGLGLAPAA